MKNTLLASACLAVFAAAPAAHAIDRDFTVHNSTGATITELYASPTSVNSWGGDLLGSDVLPNDGQVMIHYTPSMYRGQCVFDIRIVQPGGASVLRGINLCTITDVTFSRQNGRVVFNAE